MQGQGFAAISTPSKLISFLPTKGVHGMVHCGGGISLTTCFAEGVLLPRSTVNDLLHSLISWKCQGRSTLAPGDPPVATPQLNKAVSSATPRVCPWLGVLCDGSADGSCSDSQPHCGRCCFSSSWFTYPSHLCLAYVGSSPK